MSRQPRVRAQPLSLEGNQQLSEASSLPRVTHGLGKVMQPCTCLRHKWHTAPRKLHVLCDWQGLFPACPRGLDRKSIQRGCRTVDKSSPNKDEEEVCSSQRCLEQCSH